MFHICFVANEPYIKYNAVLITSIIKSTDTSKTFKDFFEINITNSLDSTQDSIDSTPQTSLQNYKKLDYESLSDDEKKEGYVFHILSDFVSDDSRQKLNNLAKELSKIYPCEIIIHICDDSVFCSLPKHIEYLKFFIPNFMPKNLKLCLYLDIDMIVLRDLRVLFTLDLDTKIAGIVLDQLQFCFANQPEFYYADEFLFHEFYFNSGLLLINLNEWQRKEVPRRAISFLRTYNNLCTVDQCALNVAIRKENALVLPFQFNIFSLFFPRQNDIVYHTLNGYKINYTQDEIKFASANPAIIHFACGNLKPWKLEQCNYILNDGRNIVSLWWEVAFETPFLKDELKQLFTTRHNNFLVYKKFWLYIASLINEYSKSFIGNLKMPFVIYKALNEFSLHRNYSANLDETLDNKYGFSLFYVAAKAWNKENKIKRIIKFAILPFRIRNTKNRCKKIWNIKDECN